MNYLRIFTLIAIFAFAMGCNKTLDDTNSPRDVSPEPKPSGTTLIILAIENGSLKPTSKANVTAQELKTHLESIDWTQRPVKQLSLSRGGYENLNILAERSAPDTPIVVWSSAKNGTPTRMKFGPIIPDSAETLKLFLSYLNQDGKYETMVEWRERLDISKSGS